MGQLTRQNTDSGTVSVVEVEVITAPLLELTERIVRSGDPFVKCEVVSQVTDHVVKHDPIENKTIALIQGGGCSENSQRNASGGA